MKSIVYTALALLVLSFTYKISYHDDNSYAPGTFDGRDSYIAFIK